MRPYNLIILLPLLALTFTQDRTAYFPKVVDYPELLPDKHNLWVFIQAGQSNMAGRGLVEPQDTIPNPRVLTINSAGEIIIAKSPINFLQPDRSGLCLGHRFGNVMTDHLPDSVSVLLLPAAVGGSGITQWLEDELFRGVSLLTNFRQNTELARSVGTLKGILWHQGESDSNPQRILYYKDRLKELFTLFREMADNAYLPVIIGELGLHDKNAENRSQINAIMHDYALSDHYVSVVPTTDLSHSGDSTHFNSEALRTMGERYAEIYLARFSQAEDSGY